MTNQRALHAALKIGVAVEREVNNLTSPLVMLGANTAIANLDNKALSDELNHAMTALTLARSYAMLFLAQGFVEDGKIQQDLNFDEKVKVLREQINEAIDLLRK